MMALSMRMPLAVICTRFDLASSGSRRRTSNPVLHHPRHHLRHRVAVQCDPFRERALVGAGVAVAADQHGLLARRELEALPGLLGEDLLGTKVCAAQQVGDDVAQLEP
jgi:hypothetical protein